MPEPRGPFQPNTRGNSESGFLACQAKCRPLCLDILAQMSLAQYYEG